MTFRKLILSLLIYLVAVGCFSVVTPETTDYVAKLSEFQALENKGAVNDVLYNNIGICYYKLDQLGRATLYFLKALNINSANSEAKTNLEFCISVSKNASLYPQFSFLETKFIDFYYFFNLNRLGWVVLILFMLLICCIHWLIHYDINKEKGLPILLIIIFSILFIFFGGMLIIKYDKYIRNSQGVIINKSVVGYSGPGNNYNRLFTVNEALIIDIERQSGSWVLLRLPNGTEGWVTASSVGAVKAIIKPDKEADRLSEQ